jgi:hypothetical protein
MGVGKPRLDAYERILSRLFENLALFHILKRVDGPHVITTETPTSLQGARRRFLSSLSFICDNRKGGDTTTSIALEAQLQGAVIFWIAANLTPKDDVLVFLADILEDLKNEPKVTDTDRNVLSDTLARKCIKFAAPRLKKECKLLSRAASYCTKYLQTNATTLEAAGVFSALQMTEKYN